jgi:hypothetical protein
MSDRPNPNNPRRNHMITQQKTRLWELSEVVEELEAAIAAIIDDESLSEEARETQLEQAFTQWLEAGESFKIKAEKVAAYIRHQESLVEARKAEARRIRILAEQAENQVSRLRRYLSNQMLLSGINRIDGVSVKVGLRPKQPRVMIRCDYSELPPEYVKVEYTPKLTEIKALIKAKGSIDWAFLSDSHEYSVTIR